MATHFILAMIIFTIAAPCSKASASGSSSSVSYFINPDCLLIADWTFNSANDLGTSFSPCLTGLSYTSGRISDGNLFSTGDSSSATDYLDVSFCIAQGSIFTLEGIQLGDVKTTEWASPGWEKFDVSIIENGSVLKSSSDFVGYPDSSDQYWEFAKDTPNSSSTGSISINALSAPQTMTVRFKSKQAGRNSLSIAELKLYGRATTTPLPEPDGIVLLGIASFGFIARRRHRVRP